MDFLLWALISLGATHIITGTHIFELFRLFFERISPNFWGVLVGCPTCMGFWIGVVLWFVGYGPSDSFDKYNDVYQIYLYGCLSSAINWLIHECLDYLHEKTALLTMKREQMLLNLEIDTKKLL